MSSEKLVLKILTLLSFLPSINKNIEVVQYFEGIHQNKYVSSKTFSFFMNWFIPSILQFYSATGHSFLVSGTFVANN